jgi:hypothetical protein
MYSCSFFFISVTFALLTLELRLLPRRGCGDLDLAVLVVEDEVKGQGTVHFGAGGVERELSNGGPLVLVKRKKNTEK